MNKLRKKNQNKKFKKYTKCKITENMKYKLRMENVRERKKSETGDDNNGKEKKGKMSGKNINILGEKPRQRGKKTA